MALQPSIADIESLKAKRQRELEALPADERRSREFDIAQGNWGNAEDDLSQLVVDLIQEHVKMMTDAAAELGVYEPDLDALNEDALAILTPLFEREARQIQDDINENRIQNVEDYKIRIQQAEDSANVELKRIDIREAQNEEDLVNRLDAIGGKEQYQRAEQVRTIAEAAQSLQMKLDDLQGTKGYSEERAQSLIAESQEKLTDTLADIGGRKDYNYATATAQWEEKMRQEEEGQLGRGRGFSGVMRAAMERVDQGMALDLGEIVRQAGTEERGATREAKYGEQGVQRDLRETLRRVNVEEQQARFQEQVARERGTAGIAETERQAGVERTTAQTEAKYTADYARAAREEVETNRQRAEQEAQVYAGQGIRAYGYGEGTPAELTQPGEVPQYGYLGQKAMEQQQTREQSATVAQVADLQAEQQAQFDAAYEARMKGIPELDTYVGQQYLKRKQSL